jgi:hypothetical protein
MQLVGLQLKPEQHQALLKRNAKEFKNYNNEEEERKRREACPLYWALFFPNLPIRPAVQGVLGHQSAPRVHLGIPQATTAAHAPPPSQEGLLETLLKNCASIAIRRHGSLLERDSLIMRVFQRIPTANTQLRLAALFMFLWAEPVIVDYVAAMYAPGSPELTAFHRVVHGMKRAVEGVLGSMPTMYNVVEKKKQLIEHDLIEVYGK